MSVFSVAKEYFQFIHNMTCLAKWILWSRCPFLIILYVWRISVHFYNFNNCSTMKIVNISVWKFVGQSITLIWFDQFGKGFQQNYVVEIQNILEFLLEKRSHIHRIIHNIDFKNSKDVNFIMSKIRFYQNLVNNYNGS